MKKLVESQREKQFGRFENKSDNILTASIKQTFGVLNMPIISTFHIFTFHKPLEAIYYN